MLTASDYAITFPYGATDGIYYGTAAVGLATYVGPYHRGDDRAMPMRTPVYVNGVLIAYSGNGNGRYDPHLHTGRFVDGRDTNPNGAGFQLDSPRVLEIQPDASKDLVNAPYIKIMDAKGVVWVYLHLDEIKITVGQVLKRGPYIMDEEDAKGVRYRGSLYREPENDQVWRRDVGRKPSDVIAEVRQSTEWLTYNHILKVAYPQATADLGKASALVQQLQSQIQALGERPTKEQLAGALQAVQTCQAQLGAATVKAESAQQLADKLNAEQVHDTEVGNSFIRFLGRLFGKGN